MYFGKENEGGASKPMRSEKKKKKARIDKEPIMYFRSTRKCRIPRHFAGRKKTKAPPRKKKTEKKILSKG